ncbi:MAG: hypothetical protein KJ906_00510 [Nanoarchaeota archaeon]|nr:hypothetical protein [Nanoarchaeota archaeon]
MLKTEVEKGKDEFKKLLKQKEFKEEYAGDIVAIYEGEVVKTGHEYDQVVAITCAEYDCKNVYFGIVPENKDEKSLSELPIVI